jgi:hypothetical protein
MPVFKPASKEELARRVAQKPVQADTKPKAAPKTTKKGE